MIGCSLCLYHHSLRICLFPLRLLLLTSPGFSKTASLPLQFVLYASVRLTIRLTCSAHISTHMLGVLHWLPITYAHPLQDHLSGFHAQPGSVPRYFSDYMQNPLSAHLQP